MQTFLLVLVMSGLLVLRMAQGQGRCSYAGVVHLDGGSRYSLSFQQAQQLCQSSHYNLATEEQLKKAYEQGLKTCRYGWIEGQKVSFIPHTSDINCSLNNTGMVSHVKSTDSLYDVYCFIPSGSLELNCEGARTSVPHASLNSWPLATSSKPDKDEDVFEEAMADGFIVNVKRTTLSVKNQKPQDNYMAATTSNTINSQQSPSLTPQEESVPRVVKDPEVINKNIEVGTELTTENLRETTSKAATMQPIVLDFGINDIRTVAELTTKETTDKLESANLESSGMFPESLQKKSSRHLPVPTVHIPGMILSTLLILPPEEEAGSGVEQEITTPSRFTTQPEMIINDSVYVKKGSRKLGYEIPDQTTREPSKVRNVLNPTASSLAEEGTPGWLIIFAFCLTVAAILGVLVGIATKDKWYKPKRRSLDITPRENPEEYGKTVTLPMVEKEQEMVTLISTGQVQKNDGDFSVISLEEHPEKEYLM